MRGVFSPLYLRETISHIHQIKEMNSFEYFYTLTHVLMGTFTLFQFLASLPTTS